ncbi:MAG: hypothetical protein LBR29_08000 [Methylobacteriaceae bacterium]|jgi:hypothetical protein|nr:hypothetical protein [Methylobacteriaceae bacterium]
MRLPPPELFILLFWVMLCAGVFIFAAMSAGGQKRPIELPLLALFLVAFPFLIGLPTLLITIHYERGLKIAGGTPGVIFLVGRLVIFLMGCLVCCYFWGRSSAYSSALTAFSTGKSGTMSPPSPSRSSPSVSPWPLMLL